MAEQLAAKLASDPERDIEARLRQLAELGDAGVRPLVEALVADRASVRDSARPLLIETVDGWALLPPAEAAPKLRRLAAALAEIAPRLGVAERRFAADLTMRVLHWPKEKGAPTSDVLLADCQRVLAAVAAKRDSADKANSTGASPSTAPPLVAMTEENAGSALVDMARLPGGGLPIELASVPAAKPSGNSPAVEPRRLPADNDSRPLPDPESAAIDRTPTPNAPGRLTDPGAHVARASFSKSASGGPMTLGKSLSAAPVRELAADMRSPDEEKAKAAKAELIHRGIDGPLLELAAQLADPDPFVRRQLAEQLPQLNGVDARPWLLELSYDADPRVRAAAVTLMATSGDWELLKRVQQVSRDDPDDQTRAQAQKALPGFRK